MIALPPAPAPAPRRQVLIGTSVAGVFVAMAFFSMLGIWLGFRADAPTYLSETPNRGIIKAWLPDKVVIPEVPANMMLISLFVACLFGQYAIYASKRHDKQNTVIGLVLTMVMGLAAINAQAVVWQRINMGVADGPFQSMFFTITGAFVAVLLAGIAYSMVAMFRTLGGRDRDTEVVSAHGIFWYIITAIFCVVWFVIYVQK